MEATMNRAYNGIIIILAVFAAETRNVISSRSLIYLLLMAIGVTLLTLEPMSQVNGHLQYWAEFGHFLLSTL